MRLFCILCIFTVFFSCTSENRDNSRAYVEGKIAGNQLKFDEISISLKNDGKIIAETNLNGSGEFVLSGPLLNDSFSLVSNKKIKSFTASKSGCKISADSLEILVPTGTTYITFNEIIVEP